MVFVRDLKHTARTLHADHHLISYDLLTYLFTYLLHGAESFLRS